MNVRLIRYTPNPETLCADAAAICTNSDNPQRALHGALSCGHDSVIEHAVFTFRVDGVSRVLLAQLTRHRIASYSVQSQRYCGAQLDCVMPDTVRDSKCELMFLRAAELAFGAYETMVENGIPPEDARYIIPEGVTCSLMVTMNTRELRRFFELRCCNRAQWEIRSLANRMLDAVTVVAPELFMGAGPACRRGTCPEGKLSCGRPMGGESR